ncbi:NHL repeat-containing protein [Aquimarina pacifica]|uniref:hypothetical protein n=1 Tax=Aquimarina pacifica TaxID=1296415 RepID=UPI000471948D|nr:hypothetical protein [Aquimarina pacifica]
MKLYYLIIFISFNISCQKKSNSQLIKVNDLSKSLNEISGIVKSSDKTLFAINDSGNSNTVFCLNNNGEIKKKIKVPESKNIDWEDLALDKNNTLYIGDFGNNANDRKNLVIYKVSNLLSNQINVSKIKYSYEDQKDFPPKKKNLNFDVEAFIHLNKSLYLFTKNRSKKSSGTTKVYKLSTKPGKHVAKLITSFELCDSSKKCMITAASINASENKIVLLTHDYVYLLKNFDQNGLENATIKKIKLHHYSQKEGVCFKNDTTLLITDEKTGNKKATLYEYTLK